MHIPMQHHQQEKVQDFIIFLIKETLYTHCKGWVNCTTNV